MQTVPVHLHVGVLPAAAADARFGTLLAPSLAVRRRQGAPLAAHVTAVVATLDGAAAGVAVGQVQPGTGVGEVLGLGVAPAARRRGMGRTLLARLEAALAEAGCVAVQGTWRSDWTGAEAVAGLLEVAGWEAPVVQKEFFKVALGGYEALPAGPPLPAPYGTSDWGALAEADRADVDALLAADDRARAMSPFVRTDLVWPEASVWLRHGGRVVGWLPVLRPSPRVAEYTGFYVAPAHRGGRVALAVVMEVAGRHARALRGGDAGAPPFGVFVAEPESPLAVRTFARVWQAQGGAVRTTVWLAGKRLPAAG